MRLQLLDIPSKDAYRLMRSEFSIVKNNPDIIYTQLTAIDTTVPVFTPCTGTDHISSPKIINLWDKEWLEWNVFSTAEHTMTLILAMMKNIHHHQERYGGDYMQDAYYGRGKDTPMSLELHGRRILIVGNGRVGRQVGRLCHAFGMVVDTCEKGDNAHMIGEKLEKADVVSFHIPLVGNEVLIDSTWFYKMRKGTVVINTSRSGIFDESALVQFCHNLKFALDVTEGYSEDTMSRLYEEGSIVTPHVGGYSDKSREATDMWIVERMLEYKGRKE